jgi:hypothetical protein
MIRIACALLLAALLFDAVAIGWISPHALSLTLYATSAVMGLLAFACDLWTRHKRSVEMPGKSP